MTVISVIVGSTRQGRFSEKPAQWILQHLKKRSGVDARLLDLRDFPMPFFDQSVSPGITKEVVFKSVDGRINDRIDDAYRAKYGGSPYLYANDRQTRDQRRCE